jgi:hypothetical protein
MLLDPRANPKSGKAIAIQKRRFGHGFIHAENLPIFGAQSNRALPRLIGRLQPLATRIRPHKSPKSLNFDSPRTESFYRRRPGICPGYVLHQSSL